MKTARKILAMVFLMALVLSLSATAFAAGDHDNYTVRIFAGNKGAFAEGNVRTQTVPITVPGTPLNYKNSDVTPNDDRYFVRGIRLAGQDNAMVIAGNYYPEGIMEDLDFVVAYGIKSSAVRYTVNYVSTGGDTLAPSETYYGNIGDKPVVAFVYVEGYQPQAYNLTKTLVEDEGSNVFTFTYSQATSTTVFVAGGGGGVVIPPAGAAAQQQGGEGAAAQQPAPAQPETIIDLDVPLAAPDDVTTEPGTEASEQTGEPAPTAEPEPPKDTKLASWIPYVLGVGGVALLSAFLVALNRRRKPGQAVTREDLEGALADAKKEVNEAENKK